MRPHTICLHDLIGKVMFINPDHIGLTRPANPSLGDNPKAKTVIEIDGISHAVIETEEEIDRLVNELKD